MTRFSKKTIDFLARAEKAKQSDWLDKNRAEFNDVVVEPLRSTVAEVARMIRPFARGYKFPSRISPRIKRSENKAEEYGALYRNYVHISVDRPTASRFDFNPGLYFSFSNERIFSGGGVYMPSSRQIKQLRTWFAFDPSELNKILRDKTFKKHFPEGMGRDKMVKTKPRDYPIDHPHIELLKMQAYYVTHPYKRSEFTSASFPEILAADWKQILRFNEVLYEYLREWPAGFEPTRPEYEDVDREELWDDRL